jgi:hypothetical protein
MGRRRKYALTQEQIDFRNSILRKKIITIKNVDKEPRVILTPDDEIKKWLWYINNCIFWINQYQDGKMERYLLKNTMQSLKYNAEKIEAIISRLTPNKNTKT